MPSTCSGGQSDGWDIRGELPPALRSRSVEMENYRPLRNVWGTDEAFLSPPECAWSLSTSFESEESSEENDNHISGLAEEIAQSMLQEEEVPADEEAFKVEAWPKPAWRGREERVSSSPTSPDSTLASFGWESQSNMGSSGVTSPPTPSEGGEVENTLYCDLLRMKLEDQVYLTNKQRQTLSLQEQIVQRPWPCSLTGACKDFHAERRGQKSTRLSGSKESLGGIRAGRDNLLSLAIDKAMMAKEGKHQLSKGSGVQGSSSEGAACTGSAAAYRRRKGAGSNGNRTNELLPNQQQQQQRFSLSASSNGAGRRDVEGGLRAVFLGVPNSRDCGGTGVFLPRRPGSSHHHISRRRPACSTVLLPSHIVHALNLRVEDTLPSAYRRDLFSVGRDDQRSIHAGVSRSQVEAATCPFLGSPPILQEIAPNISLPTEWTY